MASVVDSAEADFINAAQLTNDPIPGNSSTPPTLTNSQGPEDFTVVQSQAASPDDSGVGTADLSLSRISNLRNSEDTGSRTRITSLRRLVSKLQLTPKTENSIKRILRAKAKNIKDRSTHKKGSGTNSKIMNTSTQSKPNVKESESNTESGTALTESTEGDTLNAREDSSLKRSSKKKRQNIALEVLTIKCASSPNIYIEDKDEKDSDDDEDDFYLDDVEEEKTLKHANTMPVLPMNRVELGFPEPAVEEREKSFHKEIFLLQEYREQRPSTAQRRASLTIKNLAKDAEADLKHSWLLDEQTRELWKKFEERKRALTIVISDEDPMTAIEQRLEEVKMMSKPRKDMRHVLERLADSQKENIIVSLLIIKSQ